jgi:hypothetical protein
VALDARHPLYEDRVVDWEQLIDCYRGERRIKDKREQYLPATSGMKIDGLAEGQPGKEAYDAYLKRAVFPDFVKSAVATMVGLLHKEPATITVPAVLEEHLNKLSSKNEDVHTLLRRINEQQLLTGRVGLLIEAPDGKPAGEALPFIALYSAGRIINWDDGIVDQGTRRLEVVVIDETQFERVQDFTWELQDKHRVLTLSSETEEIDGPTQSPVAAGTYVVALVSDRRDVAPGDFMAPSIAGRTLDFIPFVFVNTEDMVPDPDEPPLLGLSNLALAVYRGEADYRQALFLQGQETLVVIGADDDVEDGEDKRVGAGSRLDLAIGGSAMYIGVAAAGLAEQRTAIENDKVQAAEQGSRLLDFSDGGGEASGRALKIRVAAKTPTLTSIAKTGAAALEEALRICAIWIGVNPNEVSVVPNLDFAEDELTGADLRELMTAKQLGAPISLRSIHTLMEKKGMTTFTFEEEAGEIETEEPFIVGPEEEDENEEELEE